MGVMSEEAIDWWDNLARVKTPEIIRNRERYLNAWIAETGLRPSESALHEYRNLDGTSRTEVLYRPHAGRIRAVPDTIVEFYSGPPHPYASAVAEWLNREYQMPHGFEARVSYELYTDRYELRVTYCTHKTSIHIDAVEATDSNFEVFGYWLGECITRLVMSGFKKNAKEANGDWEQR